MHSSQGVSESDKRSPIFTVRLPNLQTGSDEISTTSGASEIRRFITLKKKRMLIELLVATGSTSSSLMSILARARARARALALPGNEKMRCN